MPELLISADSHVKMSHDQVKAHLAARHHASYDAAAGRYEAKMQRATGAANRAGAQLPTKDVTTENDATKNVVAKNAVFRRPRYWDPVERLKDTDTDGVQTEAPYTQGSPF